MKKLTLITALIGALSLPALADDYGYVVEAEHQNMPPFEYELVEINELSTEDIEAYYVALHYTDDARKNHDLSLILVKGEQVCVTEEDLFTPKAYPVEIAKDMPLKQSCFYLSKS